MVHGQKFSDLVLVHFELHALVQIIALLLILIAESLALRLFVGLLALLIFLFVLSPSLAPFATLSFWLFVFDFAEATD